MRHGFDGHPRSGKFRDALLQGQHPLVDAHEGRAKAAVVGIEYGGGFPDDLDERFTKWSERWDAHYDTNAMKLDKAALAAEGFDEQGLALAAELKCAIGPAAKVIYYCPLRTAALEVVGDGTTIEWPRETDFRQRALEHTEGPRAYQLPTG